MENLEANQIRKDDTQRPRGHNRIAQEHIGLQDNHIEASREYAQISGEHNQVKG